MITLRNVFYDHNHNNKSNLIEKGQVLCAPGPLSPTGLKLHFFTYSSGCQPPLLLFGPGGEGGWSTKDLPNTPGEGPKASPPWWLRATREASQLTSFPGG